VFGSVAHPELPDLGFACGYDEVTRYKHSMIQMESLDSVLAGYSPGTFTKWHEWVADNVDHNLRTVDGQHTSHGMGIIAVSTREGSPCIKIAKGCKEKAPACR